MADYPFLRTGYESGTQGFRDAYARMLKEKDAEEEYKRQLNQSIVAKLAEQVERGAMRPNTFNRALMTFNDQGIIDMPTTEKWPTPTTGIDLSLRPGADIRDVPIKYSPKVEPKSIYGYDPENPGKFIIAPPDATSVFQVTRPSAGRESQQEKEEEKDVSYFIKTRQKILDNPDAPENQQELARREIAYAKKFRKMPPNYIEREVSAPKSLFGLKWGGEKTMDIADEDGNLISDEQLGIKSMVPIPKKKSEVETATRKKNPATGKWWIFRNGKWQEE